MEAREPNAKYLAVADPALVRGFQLLATAKGGVSRLRGWIRSLAVQGLLLRQSRVGESANTLLNRLGYLKHARVASSRAKAVQPTNDMLARLTGCVALELRIQQLFFEKSYDELREESAGGAQPNLNVGKIKSTLIPIPPLAEQHRIVARVEELRRLCADLRQRLTQAREIQSRLADALVAEVA